MSNNNNRAWKSFARPVGLTLSWLLSISFVIALVWGLVFVLSDSKEQNEWDRQCSIAGGEVYEQGSVKLCATVERMTDYPSYDFPPWKQGCVDLGGVPVARYQMWACYKATEIEGVGVCFDCADKPMTKEAMAKWKDNMEE